MRVHYLFSYANPALLLPTVASQRCKSPSRSGFTPNSMRAQSCPIALASSQHVPSLPLGGGLGGEIHLVPTSWVWDLLHCLCSWSDQTGNQTAGWAVLCLDSPPVSSCLVGVFWPPMQFRLHLTECCWRTGHCNTRLLCLPVSRCPSAVIPSPPILASWPQ